MAKPSEKVVALTQSEAARLLSTQPGSRCVLSIHHPIEDSNNRKSRTSLTSALINHGFYETAKLINESAELLVFEDADKAKKVLHEINNDSYAIGATLYIEGVHVGHA